LSEGQLLQAAARAGLLSALSLCIAEPARGQVNPRGLAVLELDGQEIRVEYGRPSLRGRDMIARAAPGQTWRLGADAATRLFTSAPLRFGETRIEAGEHVLRARRLEQDAWNLILVDEEELVREVPLRVERTEASVEIFTIRLEATGARKGRFALSWGTSSLSATFSLD